MLVELPTVVVCPFTKLERRSTRQYSDLYQALDSEWRLPCSELCLPILVAQNVLGCINIECSEPYAWNSAYVNMLTYRRSILSAPGRRSPGMDPQALG